MVDAVVATNSTSTDVIVPSAFVADITAGPALVELIVTPALPAASVTADEALSVPRVLENETELPTTGPPPCCQLAVTV